MQTKISASCTKYGVVESPSYPKHYPAHATKPYQWKQEVPHGCQIQLMFNYLNIMPSDCRNHSLTILHNDKEMFKYCEKNAGNHSGNTPISLNAGNVSLSLLTNEVHPDLYPTVGFSAFFHFTDVDECSNQGSGNQCSQICLNTMGSYICACHHGFMLDSDNHTCIRVKCEPPESVNGKITPTQPIYIYKEEITVHCDVGYRIITNGEEVSIYKFVCQSNGQWSLPLPKCHITKCGELTPLLNGKILTISGVHNQYHSVVKLHCNEPYAFPVTHNETYTCGEDKKWRDDQNKVLSVLPKCLPVCGRPSIGLARQKRVLGGHRAQQRTFPWHVFVHHPIRGGGAIVAEQWILTTASNLMINNQPVAVGKVKIYIGGHDAVRIVSDMQPLEIKSLHIHPFYNNTDDQNFDHDIALIKLEEPIQYNAAVMPICLPPQDAVYSSDLTGFVSGFGQTARAKISRYLRFTSFPIVDQNICQAFIDNSKIPVALTNNMFCAGVPEGGKDACSGDSGGAFVLKKDGVFWVAGIVSWGYECGKPGRYGVYTNVTQYVDWINKTMSNN